MCKNIIEILRKYYNLVHGPRSVLKLIFGGRDSMKPAKPFCCERKGFTDVLSFVVGQNAVLLATRFLLEVLVVELLQVGKLFTFLLLQIGATVVEAGKSARDDTPTTSRPKVKLTINN